MTIPPREFCITDDYIFKILFQDEELLVDFLSGILLESGKILPKNSKLLEVEFIKNEELQKLPPDVSKKVYFDLKVKTSSGLFIIEVQKVASRDYLKRADFYSAIAYSNQKIKGVDVDNYMKDYNHALPVITVSIIGDKIFHDQVPCLSYHTMLETETLEHLTGSISYVYLELGKFDNSKYSQKNITPRAKEWIHLLKDSAIDDTYSNPFINKAIEQVKYIINNKYDQYVLAQIAEQAAINEKAEAVENAMLKGIEKGMEKGMENAALSIAGKMINLGMPLKDISAATGLSEESISKIS